MHSPFLLSGGREISSSRTSHGSGSHSPNLSSVPLSAGYSPISVTSVMCPGFELKRCSNKHDNSDDDDNNNDSPQPAPQPRPCLWHSPGTDSHYAVLFSRAGHSSASIRYSWPDLSLPPSEAGAVMHSSTRQYLSARAAQDQQCRPREEHQWIQ